LHIWISGKWADGFLPMGPYLAQVTQFAVQNGLNKGKKADFQQKS
jgi:hypothetical protein